VKFYYVYKSLAHPELNNYVTPFTIEERLMHVAEAERVLGSRIPWLCDSMDNEIKRELKAAPNGEYVVDADGKIVRKRFWHDPSELRRFLEQSVGRVDHPTRAADLDLPAAPAPRTIPHGVVPPLVMDQRLTALKARPRKIVGKPDDAAQVPYFVKLVCEGDRALVRSGKGKLYLGFNLDPLYEVHWNNEAGRVSFELARPDDLAHPLLQATSPAYDHPVDLDPREFLVDLDAGGADAELVLTVRYSVCDDAETFCLPVEQRFDLAITRDPDGGSRAGDWMTELVGNPMQYDANGDGVVTRAELPEERAQIFLHHHDFDHDDRISAAEADRFHEMIRIRKGERGR